MRREMKIAISKKAAKAKKSIAAGNRFPGIDDSKLVKVKVGTVKEGSTKITPTQFTPPTR